jgi:hypothetical protein
MSEQWRTFPLSRLEGFEGCVLGELSAEKFESLRQWRWITDTQETADPYLKDLRDAVLARIAYDEAVAKSTAGLTLIEPDPNWRDFVMTQGPFRGRRLEDLSREEFEGMRPEAWLAQVERNWGSPNLTDECRRYYRAIRARLEHEKGQKEPFGRTEDRSGAHGHAENPSAVESETDASHESKESARETAKGSPPPSDILASLYSLLNRPVLLPIPRGKKKPIFARWQHTTYEDTQRPEYQHKLLCAIRRGGNIGILLGPKSGRLLALDIDDDQVVEELLNLYPWLANTLHSRGKRGRQFWFRLKEGCEYPNALAIVPLKRDGQPYGELRFGGGKGAQSVIFGIHPEGPLYQHNGKTPLEIGLADLYELTGWSGQEQQGQEREQSGLQARTAGEHAGDRILQGQEEADTLEASAEAVAKNIDAFYDMVRKEYLLREGTAVYQSLNETQFKRALRFHGLSGAPIPPRHYSQFDKVLRELQQQRYVQYAGALAGRNCGFYEENGIRFLVTSSPNVITPRPGKWDTLKALFQNLFCGEREAYGVEQQTVFYGWLKTAFEALRECKFQPGQALAFAGPPDAGKSLTQALITKILGDRSAKAAMFLQGRTDFNSDLFGAEHLILEDEHASTSYAARRELASTLKNITANRYHPCHAKHRDIVYLSPWWRVTISLNDQPERLLILPNLDADNANKISLLRADCFAMPMACETPDEKERFWKQLTSELPAFLYSLTTEYEIPRDWSDPRFGIKAWHNPTRWRNCRPP